MDADETLQPGTVLQIDPSKPVSISKQFAGCFMIVEEVNHLGAKGVVSGPYSGSHKPPGLYQAYIAWQDLALIGKAKWLPDDEEETPVD